MNNHPTYEYTDPHGDPIRLHAVPAAEGGPAVEIVTPKDPPHIPADRVEELVAGLRDTVRQAGHTPTPVTVPTCGTPCPEPGHHHTCQRSPRHLDVHRDVKQKGDETCRWDTPKTRTVAEALDIVRRWYVDVNDGAGWDADDLVRDLADAGYPLPDDDGADPR
ncbi:hypothetical protein LG634_24785 [Streptomyces bambusae]|uniref:hypothetical protein n=1 Tax=Streptomyces bambusae TaxID=1550616 RepID=UPI001CFCE052|nr:hypothetical protein [Streptomyces bambusae]MCB5168030.1 hypothetical protein [Streptomyces bambusae]